MDWIITPEPDLSGFEDAGPDLPVSIRKLLMLRDIDTTQKARIFLGSPKILTDPDLMPNLRPAVERLMQACKNSENVVVFGDYDVDGVTSSVLLVEGLRELGAHVESYIPDRNIDGYGPNSRSVRRIADMGTSLLVTADTGTSAVTEVQEANGLDMDVVVIDHHAIPNELPQAYAIVNPLLFDNSYGSEPAAVGVAYKVMEVLFSEMQVMFDADRFLDLVGLGMVCDMAPLRGESRDLVRLGISALRRTSRSGIKALCEVAGLAEADIDAESIGWILGPRLNAAGRMAHADLAFDLLISTNSDNSHILARRLDDLNKFRRKETEAAVAISDDIIRAKYREEIPEILVVASDYIGAGIIGLCASRIADVYNRPAIVIDTSGDEARASCRSIDGFDILRPLREVSDLLLKFGGHRAAAGFSIEKSKLMALDERLYALELFSEPGDLEARNLTLDLNLPFDLIDDKFLQYLALFEPHGIGNNKPVFFAPDVLMSDSRAIGKNSSHLRATFTNGSQTWQAIGWGFGEYSTFGGQRFDLAYRFKRNVATYGRLYGSSLELEIIDLQVRSSN